MSNVTEWIEEKSEHINIEIEKLFYKFKEDEKPLHTVNTHPIYCNILSYGNEDFDTIGNRDFSNENDLVLCFRKFQNIMAVINTEDVFVPSIESFCMFMGWTANVYKQMFVDTPPPTIAVMKMIDDYIIESQLSAGQLGFAKANITKFRAQVSGEHGNALVTQKDQNIEDRTSKKLKSKDQLQKELEKMGSVMPTIDNKKTTH